MASDDVIVGYTSRQDPDVDSDFRTSLTVSFDEYLLVTFKPSLPKPKPNVRSLSSRVSMTCEEAASECVLGRPSEPTGESEEDCDSER